MRSNSIKRSAGLKISCIMMLTLLVVVGFASMVPVVEEADGWQGFTDYMDSVYPKRGFVYYTTYDSSYHQTSSSNYRIGRYYSGTGYHYYYRGWVGFSLDGIPDTATIDSASFLFNINSVSSGCDFNPKLKLLDVNPHSGDAESIFNGIYFGTDCGSYRVTRTGAPLITLNQAGLDALKQKIRDGDQYVYFGLDFNDANYQNEYFLWYQTYSYYNRLNINYDSLGPSINSLSEPDPIIDSRNLEISYSGIDNPTNGNAGIKDYQVGLFHNETSIIPYDTMEWTPEVDQNITGLIDGEQYFIRVRGRDNGDFVGDWSDAINTTIDLSPPTIPILEPVTQFSEGTSFTVDWSESIDAGIGLSNYTLQRSTDPGFSTFDDMIFGPGNNSYTYDDCVNAETYYFRMKANDTFDHQSEFCSTISTTMDDEAPSVPVMMVEPIYTKGLNNTFQWHPAVDNGVGMDRYQIQIANAETFGPGEILDDVTTDQTFTTFMDLEDGTNYYVRVRSIDDFNYTSDWSSVEWSVQDDTGPGEPGLISLMEYQMDGAVNLDWEGSIDDGVGVGWYKVEWSKDMNFVTGVEVKDHVLGQSMTILSLDTDVPYYFRVTSFDTLGTMGSSDTTSTTLDSLPPDAPVVSNLGEFTIGTSKMISWSGSDDDVSGLDHYLLEVFSDEEATIKTFEIHTMETEFEVPGLMGGQTYFYRITAFDTAGNSITSEIKFSTQDDMAPTIDLVNGDLFGSNDPTIEGSVFDATSGVATVEISSNEGETWDECPLSTETWIYSMANIPPGTTTAWVRSTDNIGNIGEPVIVNIDNLIPLIQVTSPIAGSLITGPVQIAGKIVDPHLASYSIDYKQTGTEDWNSIIPDQHTSDFSGVMGAWLPAGLPDGDYLIRVEATDSLGQSSMISFNLTLNQASLSLGPSSITFSDVDPILGETVTVSVAVSNLGSSDAEDVTITLFDDENEIKRVTGQTVPAMDVLTIDVELPITGFHNITARASSEWYDTGDMSTAAKLVAELPEEEPPEEGFMEDNAGILGLLALIIGILAIIIAIIIGVILSKRKPEQAQSEGLPPSEKKEEMPPAPSAPKLDPAGARSEELPPTEKKELPSLPPPTTPAEPEPAPTAESEPTPAPAEPEFQAPPSAGTVPLAEPPVEPATPELPEVQLPK